MVHLIQAKAKFSYAIAVMDRIGGWIEGGILEDGSQIGGRLAGVRMDLFKDRHMQRPKFHGCIQEPENNIVARITLCQHQYTLTSDRVACCVACMCVVNSTWCATECLSSCARSVLFALHVSDVGAAAVRGLWNEREIEPTGKWNRNCQHTEPVSSAVRRLHVRFLPVLACVPLRDHSECHQILISSRCPSQDLLNPSRCRSRFSLNPSRCPSRMSGTVALICNGLGYLLFFLVFHISKDPHAPDFSVVCIFLVDASHSTSTFRRLVPNSTACPALSLGSSALGLSWSSSFATAELAAVLLSVPQLFPYPLTLPFSSTVPGNVPHQSSVAASRASQDFFHVITIFVVLLAATHAQHPQIRKCRIVPRGIVLLFWRSI